MNKTIILLLTIVLPALGLAQVTTAETAKGKAKDFYERAYITRNFLTCDSLARMAVKESPNFIDAWFLIGTNNFDQNKYLEAAQAFEKVKTLAANYRYDIDLQLARCYEGAAEYAKARDNAKSFLLVPKLSLMDKLLAEKILADSYFAEDALKHPLNIDVVNMGPGINSAVNEAGPYLTADSKFLYYTRRESLGAYSDEDIYYSVKTGNTYGQGNSAGEAINTFEYIEGAQCISASGKYLLFTSYDRRDGMGSADIYMARRVDNHWERANNVGPPINGRGWDGEPSLSADGRTLFFSSVRADGYGQRDIWCSQLNPDGTWAAPFNLGDSINTGFNDEAPFIHPDGKTLYFSSNGRPGMGNYDLYMSKKLQNGKWSKAVNLGYPINTSRFEVSIFVSTDGSTAYFSSQREDSYGGTDIYKFNMPESKRPDYTSFIAGNVFDKESRDAVLANVQIYDIETGKLFATSSSDKFTGAFLATLPAGKNYAVEVMKDGYLFWSHNVSLKEVKEGTPVEVNIPLQQIKVGEAIVLNNIFYESDKYNLKDESNTELEMVVKLMNKNPTLKIEIGGHTDNTGNEQNNEVLSENRAKSVYNYLVGKQIDADRITYKGYASTKPVASNATEESKAKNRRTELVVTGI